MKPGFLRSASTEEALPSTTQSGKVWLKPKLTLHDDSEFPSLSCKKKLPIPSGAKEPEDTPYNFQIPSDLLNIVDSCHPGPISGVAAPMIVSGTGLPEAVVSLDQIPVTNAKVGVSSQPTLAVNAPIVLKIMLAPLQLRIKPDHRCLPINQKMLEALYPKTLKLIVLEMLLCLPVKLLKQDNMK